MGEPICFGFPKKGDRRIVMFRKILVLLVEPHFFLWKKSDMVWVFWGFDHLRELQYLTVFLATKRSNFPRSGGLEGPTLQKPPVLRISKSSAGTTAMRNGHWDHYQQKANNGIWFFSATWIEAQVSRLLKKHPEITINFHHCGGHFPITWSNPRSCWIWTMLKSLDTPDEDPTLQPLVFQNAQGLHSRRWCPGGPWLPWLSGSNKYLGWRWQSCGTYIELLSIHFARRNGPGCLAKVWREAGAKKLGLRDFKSWCSSCRGHSLQYQDPQQHLWEHGLWAYSFWRSVEL